VGVQGFVAVLSCKRVRKVKAGKNSDLSPLSRGADGMVHQYPFPGAILGSLVYFLISAGLIAISQGETQDVLPQLLAGINICGCTSCWVQLGCRSRAQCHRKL
jgi:hypothetical protein